MLAILDSTLTRILTFGPGSVKTTTWEMFLENGISKPIQFVNKKPAQAVLTI